MSNRSRIVLGSLGGAFAIHLAALACSGNHSIVGTRDASMADAGAAQQHDGGIVDVITSALDAVGDAMGGVVRDVATKVVDAEVPDAHAGGRVVEVACNLDFLHRDITDYDGGTTFQSNVTTWFGVVPGVTARTQDAPLVTGYTCDPERFSPVTTCPAGHRCEDRGTPLPTTSCQPVTGFVADDGRVYVNCGYRQEIVAMNGTTTTLGVRYRRAYVRISWE